MQLMMDSVKEGIKSLKQSVDEMKQSLHYTQKDIDDLKTKTEKIEEKTKNVDKSTANSQMDIEDLYNEQEYLENQSRRNNVKVLRIPEKNEKDGIETWDECEEKVKEEIKAKFGIKTDREVLKCDPRSTIRTIQTIQTQTEFEFGKYASHASC